MQGKERKQKDEKMKIEFIVTTIILTVVILLGMQTLSDYTKCQQNMSADVCSTILGD